MISSDKAVEAMAKVLVEDGARGVPWGDASGDDRAEAMGKARILHEAAAPYMQDSAEGTPRPCLKRHAHPDPAYMCMAPEGHK
jgi:hypothetical protein